MTDEDLMNRYRLGNEEAFNALYEKYSSRVYGFIQRRLPASELEDFYQKVWRRLHEKRGLYADQPFAPWFFVLIRHLLIDEYRALSSRKKLEFSLQPEIEEFGQQDVRELLKTLPPEVARLIESHYLDEKSYEELSQDLGFSEATIRQRLSRGIRGLREKVRGSL